MKDFLIVGQGIAGTLVADQLLKSGSSVLVVDDENNNSSRVAAGLYNPVTGRKMVKSWKADELFASVEDFYEGLENDLETQFLHKKRIYRPFTSIAEQNDWEARKSDPKFIPYICNVYRESLYPGEVNDPYGGLELNLSGYLDIKVMLDAYRKKLKDMGSFAGESFQAQELEIGPSSFSWKGDEYRNIVFCEGITASENPYFKWLPYHPLKGEILTVKLRADFKHIINRGVFVLGKEKDHYVVGSTYNWREPWSGITEEGKNNLSDRLKQLINVDFEVIDHRSGVRPSTQDRRPIIGEHPEIKNMWIFNGLGTKGVSLAPFFVKQFTESLVDTKVLDSLVNINRYYSLYFHSSSS